MNELQRLMKEQEEDLAQAEKDAEHHPAWVADGRFSGEGLTRRQFKKKLSEKFHQPKFADLLMDKRTGRTI